MRIEVSQAPPESDAESWDHMVELPLPVPSGRLVFQASGGAAPVETHIPTGNYRARFSGRGYVIGAGEIEAHVRHTGYSSGLPRRRNLRLSGTGPATT